MKLELVRFNEDTGTCELDIDEEGKVFLIERGFNALLMDALKRLEVEHESEKAGGVQQVVVVNGNAGRTNDP